MDDELVAPLWFNLADPWMGRRAPLLNSAPYTNTRLMLAHTFIRIMASGIFGFAVAALFAAAATYRAATADCEYIVSIGFLCTMITVSPIIIAAVAIIGVAAPPVGLLERVADAPLIVLDTVR